MITNNVLPKFCYIRKFSIQQQLSGELKWPGIEQSLNREHVQQLDVDIHQELLRAVSSNRYLFRTCDDNMDRLDSYLNADGSRGEYWNDLSQWAIGHINVEKLGYFMLNELDDKENPLELVGICWAFGSINDRILFQLMGW